MSFEKLDSLLTKLRQVHESDHKGAVAEVVSTQQDFEKKMFDAMYNVALANGRVLKLPKTPDGEVDWKKLGSAIRSGIDQFLHDLT